MKLSIWDRFIRSFDATRPDGYSARKLSAFAGVCIALVITYKYTDNQNLHWTIGIWLTFASLCLSIVTAEQIIKFKNGKAPEKEP